VQQEGLVQNNFCVKGKAGLFDIDGTRIRTSYFRQSQRIFHIYSKNIFIKLKGLYFRSIVEAALGQTKSDSIN